jgi:hypothetical protein
LSDRHLGMQQRSVWIRPSLPALARPGLAHRSARVIHALLW